MSKARDIADLDFNSPDIDGGNIDGAVIGASTAAAATVSTFTVGDSLFLQPDGNNDLLKSTGGVLYLKANEYSFQNNSGVEWLSFDSSGNADFSGSVTATAATFTEDVALNNGSPELYFGTTGNHYNWRLAAQEAVDAAFEIGVGSQDTNYADDTYTPVVVVKNNGSFEIGYGGAARQQADSQALTITTPATGGGQGIALKRLDSNSDQTLGEISWSNNTQDGLSTISSKTAGAVNTTDMLFKVNNAGSEVTAITIDGSASGKTIFGGNIEVETGGYPLVKLQTSSSNYFEFLFDNPNDRLRIGKNGAEHLLINSSGVIKTQYTEFLGFEDAINILNHDPVDGGTDFDQTPTNNSDGGQTHWQMSGDGNSVYFYSTSGGHGGTWMKVYCDAGLWAIKGSVRLTNTDGAVHGNTSTDNYKFTHSFRFEISGGPDTGTVKFDADAAASNTGTDFTRIAFSSAPVSMTAGYKTISYATNGYDGVQQIYITDLQLVKVG